MRRYVPIGLSCVQSGLACVQAGQYTIAIPLSGEGRIVYGLGLDDFGFELLGIVIIQVELALEGAIGDPLLALE